MPNTPVKFKLGLQTKINEYLNGGTGWEVGTFYLTSDSNRLYVGQADGIQLLNKVVQVYSSLDQLPSASQAHEGDFAYISGSSTNTDGNGNAGKGNILAYFNGNQWIQINYSTDTVNKTLTNQASDVTSGVGIKTTVTDTKNKIVEDTFTIKGAKGAQVTRDGDKGILVTGDTYTLSSAAADNIATLTLDSALQSASTVKVEGGDNVTIVADANTKNIKISSKNTVNKSAALTLTDNGLVSTITDDKAVSSDALKLGYNIGSTFYGIGSDAKTSELPVYTKKEVDQLFTDLNGVTYCGTVGSSNATYQMNGSYQITKGTAATLEPVHNGDMFLVDADVTYALDKTAKQGDLLIATGKEDNGVLKTITWTYIPSGNDMVIDTHYNFAGDAAQNSWTVSSQAGSTTKQVGSIKFVKGTALDISSTASPGTNLEVTIKHADVTQTIDNKTDTSQLGNGGTFTVVNKVTSNAQGHVTEITSTPTKLPVYGTGNDVVAVTGNTATITHFITANGSNVGSGTGTIVSDTLTLTKGADANALSVELTWGSF